MQYVAFLRGINVGGHKKVPMAELRNSMEDNGFQNVQTVLASGNVIFNCDEDALKNLKIRLENLIETEFGFTSSVQVYPASLIQDIIDKDPFVDVSGENAKCYVTFVPFELGPVSIDADDPFVRHSLDNVLFGVVNLDDGGSIDFMETLDMQYGKDVTTRTFGTVQKIAKKLDTK